MKNITLDSSFLYLVSICLLFIIVLQLLLRRKAGDSKASSLLLLYFTSYLYLIGITYFFIYGNATTLIHTLRTGHIPSLLMPPLAYLYMRQCLYTYKWKWIYILHLLPALIFIIDMFPFFLSSAAEKSKIFTTMDAVEYRIGFSQGFFMPKFAHITIRTLQLVAYWIAQFVMLQKAKNSNFHPLRLASPYTWKWLHLFLYTQSIVFLLPLVGIFFKDGQLEIFLYSIGGALTMGFQCFYLLLHPEILYTETYKKEEKTKFIEQNDFINEIIITATDKTISKKEPDAIISIEELQAIEMQLDNYMKIQKPYTASRYTLQQFAFDTKILPHKLSLCINNLFQINFNEYLNRYRVTLFIEKVKQGENKIKTLEAMATECGFQSRATFVRAFKKEKGITPSDYVKKIGLN